jgi:hypothetical protein
MAAEVFQFNCAERSRRNLSTDADGNVLAGPLLSKRRAPAWLDHAGPSVRRSDRHLWRSHEKQIAIQRNVLDSDGSAIGTLLLIACANDDEAGGSQRDGSGGVSRAMSGAGAAGSGASGAGAAGSIGTTFVGAKATFARWAQINKCTGSPSAADTNGCSSYTTCDGGAEVCLCMKQDGGHESANAPRGLADAHPALKEGRDSW